MYRINELLKLDRKLFHTRDLALLWNIRDDNTLYTQIKRYVDKGILLPIHKGFYATVPLETIDPLELGINALHRYAYVSCEFILAKEGVIFQHSPLITLVSSVSRNFTLTTYQYHVRMLNNRYLYNDCGIESAGNYRKASIERSVADLLYFNPRFHIDNREGINWKKVATIRNEVGYR